MSTVSSLRNYRQSVSKLSELTYSASPVCLSSTKTAPNHIHLEGVQWLMMYCNLQIWPKSIHFHNFSGGFHFLCCLSGWPLMISPTSCCQTNWHQTTHHANDNPAQWLLVNYKQILDNIVDTKPASNMLSCSQSVSWKFWLLTSFSTVLHISFQISSNSEWIVLWNSYLHLHSMYYISK